MRGRRAAAGARTGQPGRPVEQGHGTRRVTGAGAGSRSLVENERGVLVRTQTKTRAGTRSVPAPGVVMDALRAHMNARWSQPGTDGLVFTAQHGGPVRVSVLRRRESLEVR